MNKTFMTVNLTLHGGEDWGYEDYIDNNGKFHPLAVRALAMLEKHQQIYINDGGYIDIIPYHAIVKYDATKETREYTQPEDAFCNEDVCPTSPNCSESATRILSLPRYDGNSSTLQEDQEFLFTYEIPYLINNGISVKFKGEEVLSVAAGTPDDPTDIMWNLTTDQGVHVLLTNNTGDYDLIYPTVDGETVDLVSFTIGTEKRYVLFSTLSGGSFIKVSDGLYKVGEKPVVSGEYTDYMKRAFQMDSERTPFPEGGVFPAVTNDIWYTLN